ncbi:MULTISPECIES: PaaI family thioesterase [Shouchella]|uniref:PaaI family thioesterase n=1 Tax=Shouchella TaxID=2893057 RepID=UPI000AE4FE0D|nr:MULTISPECIES: PaaI family thioesterase [Bacillaceae]
MKTVTVEEKIQAFLNEASPEEKNVFEQVVDGFIAKQQKQQLTYLSGITQAEASTPSKDTFSIRVPITPLIHNPLSIVHGGMTATLLDSTMGGAAMQSLPDHLTAVTSQLNIHYMRPGVGEYLECFATVVHSGKQLIVVEGNAYNNEKKLIAKATGTFFVIPLNK